MKRTNTSLEAKKMPTKANILKELISNSFTNNFKNKRKSNQVMRKKLLQESKKNTNEHLSTLDFLDTCLYPITSKMNKHHNVRKIFSNHISVNSTVSVLALIVIMNLLSNICVYDISIDNQEVLKHAFVP